MSAHTTMGPDDVMLDHDKLGDRNNDERGDSTRRVPTSTKANLSSSQLVLIWTENSFIISTLRI